ncbi:hypothetical protein DL93DRAFT_1732745 [Clavulina sp. PMI_390]|nr:hypothetical protein DL93DRAFT_1732745 [Clavulina sp. PMI_390]
MISQTAGASHIMDALSSNVEVIVTMLSSILPSETLQLLPRGAGCTASMRATVDASEAQINQIHGAFDKIVKKGYAAVAAARFRLNAARSPIYTLPVEILSEIIRYAVKWEGEGYEGSTNPTLVLRLSRISHAWRSTTLNFPELFTDSANWGDWPPWLCQEWYKRSRGLPIAIDITAGFLFRADGAEKEELRHYMRSLAPRTETINILGHIDRLEHRMPLLISILSDPHLSRVSKMELMNLQETIRVPPKMLINLRSLILDCSYLTTEPSSSFLFPSLEHLSLDFSFRETFTCDWESIIDAAPNLRTIAISDATYDESRLPSRERTSLVPRTLQNLEMLALTGVALEDVRFLLDRWRLPNAKIVALEEVFEYDKYSDIRALFNVSEFRVPFTRVCPTKIVISPDDFVSASQLLSNAAPNLMRLQITVSRHRLIDAVRILTNTANIEPLLPEMTELSLYDPKFDWGNEPTRDGDSLDAQLLGLASSRRLELLRLFFSPSKEMVTELKKTRQST